MDIAQLDFFGDVNLGLYAKVSDKFCIAGNFLSEKSIEKMEKLFKTTVVKTHIAGTDLVGIFSVMNSKGLLLPSIVSENEIKILKSHGLEVAILKTKFTALGNVILANDKGSVISELVSTHDKKIVEDVLDVEAIYTTVANLNNVGSSGVATNRGCFLHRDAESTEIKNIEHVLKVNVGIGTANFGSPFVGSCVLANSKGALVGGTTTGPEVVRVMEALGFA